MHAHRVPDILQQSIQLIVNGLLHCFIFSGVILVYVSWLPLLGCGGIPWSTSKLVIKWHKPPDCVLLYSLLHFWTNLVRNMWAIIAIWCFSDSLLFSGSEIFRLTAWLFIKGYGRMHSGMSGCSKTWLLQSATISSRCARANREWLAVKTNPWSPNHFGILVSHSMKDE